MNEQEHGVVFIEELLAAALTSARDGAASGIG